MCTLADVNGIWYGRGVPRFVVRCLEIACGGNHTDAFASDCRTGAAKVIQRRWRVWLERRRRDNAADTIASSWKRAISDPSYALCKTRLRREYGELAG